MRCQNIIFASVIYSLLSRCAGNTKEEIEKMNKAAATVAGVLFENDFDTSTDLIHYNKKRMQSWLRQG